MLVLAALAGAVLVGAIGAVLVQVGRLEAERTALRRSVTDLAALRGDLDSIVEDIRSLAWRLRRPPVEPSVD